MPIALNSLQDLAELEFDEIIDVRSPAEYAEDHILGAVNLPVLSDEERMEVGTLYKQESPFKARKIGAALVAQNAARHLQTFLLDKPGSYRPLVYCWRGGQRSNAFASILSQIGWRAEVLDGGYKTYRRKVKETLYEQLFPSPVFLLDGDTGSGKTDILQKLPALGWQVLDLETMARHRGSVLGGYAEAQPSQKGFESDLAARVLA
ncbi:MAG: tRNA 2-selenouridine(34) synthase MnmH, partial [Dinoroseobacter sp.]|nr:tRNA 2-selenouridine(34) synthase MnmH [Dinoroseobacter sp.]